MSADTRKTLEAMLAEAFAIHSGATAVEWGTRRVSYGELDTAVNQIAVRLADTGVTAGARVVVALDERIDVVAALLATLRAGCVFVPIDPQAPASHLRRIVTDVQPAAVLVDGGTEALIGCVVDGGRPMVVVDWAGGPERAAEPPPSAAVEALAGHPRELAYIYYTSGSTGVPKGIAGTLHGVAHFVRWETERFEIRAGARFSQLTAPTFDAFFRDVFVPLCSGGTICVPPGAETLLDAEALVAWIDAAEVELIHCVPSLFAAIVSANPAPPCLGALRWILMAGETLPVGLVRRWRALQADRVRLANLYGATETTMIKFCHELTSADLERASIPIGRPIPGARALVLDSAGRPCPPGVAGEIHVRTPYRTLGYYRQPEKTREVFVPNPFSDDPEDRIYRTGDLGRVDRKGTFHFVGRMDEQIKIRGVRVEPGEIQAALEEHPGVGRSVVLARGETAEERRLVAWVVAADGSGLPSIGELKQHLEERLPRHLVPQAVVMLEAFPLSPNGKIDRRGLPDPDASRPELASSYEAPRTATERVVAEIWSDVLGIETVGVDDGFFELGGHSLIATRVISRIRRQFGRELPLKVMFERPTVAHLAAAIDRAAEEPQTLRPPISRRDPEAELPLSFAQQRVWFFDQLVPGSPYYNMPFAIRLRGTFDRAAFVGSVAEVVRRHDVLRTVFPAEGRRPAQSIAGRNPGGIPRIDLRGLPEQARESEARRLAVVEALRPFDLARGPLLRVHLLELDDRDHAVLLTMHHIVSDAWSIGILVRELGAAYQALVHGVRPLLPDLSVQYADFAIWQRGWLRGDVLEEHLAYWKPRLKGLPPLDLKTDRPRPAVQSFRGERRSILIPGAVVEGLHRASERHGATMFMTMLAAFKVLLAHETGTRDVVVGTNVANRNHEQVEGLIGFFINQLVLRTDLSGDPAWSDLMARVRDVTLGAFAHQDLPFEKLVEDLDLPRDPSRSIGFQAKIDFQHVPVPDVELPDVSIRPMELQFDAARHDLHLIVLAVGGQLSASLVYPVDLFDGATVERMLAGLGVVLREVATGGDPALAELERCLDDHARSSELRQAERLQRSQTPRLRAAKRKTIRGGP